jgi:hypothetical protein
MSHLSRNFTSDALSSDAGAGSKARQLWSSACLTALGRHVVMPDHLVPSAMGLVRNHGLGRQLRVPVLGRLTPRCRESVSSILSRTADAAVRLYRGHVLYTSAANGLFSGEISSHSTAHRSRMPNLKDTCSQRSKAHHSSLVVIPAPDGPHPIALANQHAILVEPKHVNTLLPPPLVARLGIQLTDNPDLALALVNRALHTFGAQAGHFLGAARPIREELVSVVQRGVVVVAGGDVGVDERQGGAQVVLVVEDVEELDGALVQVDGRLDWRGRA